MIPMRLAWNNCSYSWTLSNPVLTKFPAGANIAKVIVSVSLANTISCPLPVDADIDYPNKVS